MLILAPFPTQCGFGSPCCGKSGLGQCASAGTSAESYHDGCDPGTPRSARDCIWLSRGCKRTRLLFFVPLPPDSTSTCLNDRKSHDPAPNRASRARRSAHVTLLAFFFFASFFAADSLASRRAAQETTRRARQERPFHRTDPRHRTSIQLDSACLICL